MAINLAYSGESRPRRWGLDVLVLLMGGMACLMLAGPGGSVAVISAMSIVGLPVSALLMISVPVAAALLPMRIAFVILRRGRSWFVATVLSILIGAGSFVGVDAALRAAPDGTNAALAVIARDSPLLAVERPANGVIGVYTGNEDTSCAVVCRSLLRSGLARSVVMMSAPNTPAVRYNLPVNGTCANGIPTAICSRVSSSALPMLTYSLTPRPVPTDMPALQSVWQVNVRSGAIVQTTHLVQAQVPQGGGLLAPNATGILGEDMSYLPRPSIQTFAVFDRDGMTLPQPDIQFAFEAAILHTLAER